MSAVLDRHRRRENGAPARTTVTDATACRTPRCRAAALALSQLPPGAAARSSVGWIPSHAGLPWASGARDADPNSFVAYRERPIDVLVTFSEKQAWAGIRASGDYNYRSLLGPAQNRQEVIVVSYPLFPIEQNPRDHGMDLWRRAANGEFDWHHAAAASSFTKYSQKFVFRPGWEWNTRRFAPWSCIDVALASYYITYFRRVVDLLREHVPTCRINWCSTKKGETNASIDKWYPGDDWVDYVGHDKYDWYIAARTQAEWDENYNALHFGGPAGIGAWLTYAKSKGKKLCVSEWAVVSNHPDGGGDNAYFVQRMHYFFRLNAADLGYECYFNRNAGTYVHKLQDNPAAGRKYRWVY
jgi:hypothetical protein